MSANPGRGPASEFWRHTLARIPTHFGRLVYLSSLRNQHSNRYEHQGLAQILGEEQASETLRRSHVQVFQDWLCLNLERQKTDLQEYLAELPANPATVLAAWRHLQPYRDLVPKWRAEDEKGMAEMERQLYLTDIETVLELLRHEYGAVSPDPES
jgi:hypothetical protein